MPKGHGEGSKATQFKCVDPDVRLRFEGSFIPEPMSGCWLWEAGLACDMPCCVNPDHLYLGTQKDNMRDRSVRNRMADQRGERSHRAKLTANQVLAIRKDKRSQRLIGSDFKISQSEVSLIKLRKHWGHI